MRIERRFTEAGKSPYDAIPFRDSASEIRNPDGSVVFSLERFPVPAHWSGSRPTSWPRNISAKPACRPRPSRSRRIPSRPGCGGRSPTRPRSPRCPRASASAARPMRARCSTGWPEPGPIGAGRAAISPPRRMRRPSMTSSATCSPCRWARPTARNGSIPACIGPMASMARARVIIMSTSPPAR